MKIKKLVTSLLVLTIIALSSIGVYSLEDDSDPGAARSIGTTDPIETTILGE